MQYHKDYFPFDEIRDKGNYFLHLSPILELGYKRSQIWSVATPTIEEGSPVHSQFVYGPSHHFVDVIGYIATEEHHDNQTYYIEEYFWSDIYSASDLRAMNNE